jgi:cytochrome c556
MAWIEVKVRSEKTTELGKKVKATEPYLVDALSCTEAEARVVEEVSNYTDEFNVLNVGKTKISEIFWDESADKFYRVKVNFITLDEKTAQEKRSASYILVQASSFDEALTSFHAGMKGTLADYEVESITETKIVDVFKYKTHDN